MTDREAMQMALEALKKATEHLPVHFDSHFEAIAALRAQLEQQAEPVTCAWSFEDDDTGTYSSSCGELWSFIDGGWKDNHVRFCHGCGGKVVEAKLRGTHD